MEQTITLDKYSKGSKVCDLISIKKRRADIDLNKLFLVPEKSFMFEDVTNVLNEHMLLKDNMFVKMLTADKECINLQKEKKMLALSKKEKLTEFLNTLIVLQNSSKYKLYHAYSH